MRVQNMVMAANNSFPPRCGTAGGRRLLFYSLDQTVKGVLAVTRLDRIFEIVDDRCTAMPAIAAQPENAPGERIRKSAKGSG